MDKRDARLNPGSTFYVNHDMSSSGVTPDSLIPTSKYRYKKPRESYSMSSRKKFPGIFNVRCSAICLKW